mgnify:CR=1 FL=1
MWRRRENVIALQVLCKLLMFILIILIKWVISVAIPIKQFNIKYKTTTFAVTNSTNK